MISKKLLASLIIFPTVSLIGTGFSSWLLIEGGTSAIAGNITIPNAIYLNNYVSFDVISMFTVCQAGLVRDDTIVYDGEVTFNFNVKIKDGIINYLGDTSKLSIEISISNGSSFDVINSSYVNSNIAYCYSTSSYIDTFENSTTGTFNNSSLLGSLIYNSSIDEIDILYFSIKLKFDFSSVSSTFSDSIYNPIVSNGGLKFNLSVGWGE